MRLRGQPVLQRQKNQSATVNVAGVDIKKVGGVVRSPASDSSHLNTSLVPSKIETRTPSYQENTNFLISKDCASV